MPHGPCCAVDVPKECVAKWLLAFSIALQGKGLQSAPARCGNCSLPNLPGVAPPLSSRDRQQALPWHLSSTTIIGLYMPYSQRSVSRENGLVGIQRSKCGN
eukprot:172396-Amphidinium_carterae.1